MPEFIKDNTGRVIGNIRQDGNKKVYSDEEGRVVAYVKKDSSGKETTLDASGRLVGSGDQGMRKLG